MGLKASRPVAGIMALSAILLATLVVSVLLTTVSYLFIAIMILAVALLVLMGWIQAKKVVCASVMVPP